MDRAGGFAARPTQVRQAPRFNDIASAITRSPAASPILAGDGVFCCCPDAASHKSHMDDSLIAFGADPITAPDIRSLCDRELLKLCDRHPEVSMALVASADAWLISCRSSEKMDAHRLSAMTTSLLALCEPLSKELSGGGCQSVLLSMDSYTCVVLHITSLQRSLVLAIGVPQTLMPALARRFAMALAERISLSLRALESDTVPSG